MPWERPTFLSETRRLRADVCPCGRNRSFDEFWERKFLESRRKASYHMAMHEQLPRIHNVELQRADWTKARELVMVARLGAQRFDCATWLHKARDLPKEEIKPEVSKHLTGKGTERGNFAISSRTRANFLSSSRRVKRHLWCSGPTSREATA